MGPEKAPGTNRTEATGELRRPGDMTKLPLEGENDLLFDGDPLMTAENQQPDTPTVRVLAKWEKAIAKWREPIAAMDRLVAQGVPLEVAAEKTGLTRSKLLMLEGDCLRTVKALLRAQEAVSAAEKNPDKAAAAQKGRRLGSSRRRDWTDLRRYVRAYCRKPRKG